MAIREEILDYCQGLLGTTFQRAAINELMASARNLVHKDWWDDLIKPVSEDEIMCALKSIKGEKAPGTDGFSSAFYHQNWDLMGSNLVDAVKQFFFFFSFDLLSNSSSVLAFCSRNGIQQPLPWTPSLILL